MRIVHMTSVHSWNDVRIFLKMCRFLSQAGHEVHLVVPRETDKEEIHDGVCICPVSLPENRLDRMFATVTRVLDKAQHLKADIYHVHDPEFLLRLCSFQRKVNSPVVIDMHEDVRLQMFYKNWLPRRTRGIVSWAYGLAEDRIVTRLKAVVAATPSIAERFSSHKNCVVVQNYPLISEMAIGAASPVEAVPGRFAFAGCMMPANGVAKMIEALSLVGGGARLALAGKWSSTGYRQECTSKPGWTQVEEMGFLGRSELVKSLRLSVAGLLVSPPERACLTAKPNKFFEYMAAGLPLIVSDFPLWRAIVEQAECGILVDPLNESDIAAAMRYVMDHPEEARAMGERGRKAVEKEYNWESEFVKIEDLYRRL